MAAQGYSGWNNATIDVNNPSGVQSVYFPSMSLGLAVGLNMFNPTAMSPTGMTGSGSPYPTILSTVDMGLTWQARSRLAALRQPAGPPARQRPCSPGGAFGASCLNAAATPHACLARVRACSR